MSTSQKDAASEWVEKHVPRFAKIRPAYERFAQMLMQILDQAAVKLAPQSLKCSGSGRHTVRAGWMASSPSRCRAREGCGRRRGVPVLAR
jgi:hypothetical protein